MGNQNITIGMRSIIEDLNWRYACKKFDASQKLDSALLEVVLQSINLTATSLGMQMMKCVLVKNQTLKDQLVPACYNQMQVADCSAVLVFCRYNEVTESHVEEYVNRSAKTRNIALDHPKIQGFKKMIESTVSMPDEQRKHWMNNQVYIALGNLMTVCAHLRIDACPMEGFVPQQVDEILDLHTQGLSSVVLCPIGYRHEDDPYATMPKVRRNIEDFVLRM
jgi:nitroreductase